MHSQNHTKSDIEPSLRPEKKFGVARGSDFIKDVKRIKKKKNTTLETYQHTRECWEAVCGIRGGTETNPQGWEEGPPLQWGQGDNQEGAGAGAGGSETLVMLFLDLDDGDTLKIDSAYTLIICCAPFCTNAIYA